MRIGIDARLWNESGVGRYIRNLVQHLIILDCKNEYVLFVLPKDYENIKYQISPSKADPPLEENIKKNNNWRIVEANIRWHSLDEQIRLPQILNREKLDLMHFPYFSVPIFYNRPFIVTIHDLIIDHFPTGQASTLFLPVYKMKLFGYQFVVSQTAKKAKKIITVSEATKREIIEHFKVNEDKVVVTYEGIDKKISNLKSQISPPKTEQSLEEKPHLKSQNYFLYVGNAYPHKNLLRLIKAFASFKSSSAKEGSDFKLIMVGREDYFYKRLKEKVRIMGLEKKVEFKYDIDDSELAYLYKNAKALITPSLMEGFGLPVVEAMINKCLVICSDIPVFHEICKDSALYFDPYNVNDISEKIRGTVYSDAHYYSGQLNKGYERAKEFSWLKMAEETLKIYESCISIRSDK